MEENLIYHVIGLMSGTSLDGIDLAYCNFIFSNKKWKYEILETKMINYSPEWKNKLRNAIYISSQELNNLDVELGKYFGKEINQFIVEKSIQKIDFISSHGHTIFHQPEKKFTLQIGNGEVIKNTTKIKTVFDFRSKDVSLGGQGAPLVPVGDKLLFSEYDYCVNIGGIANISYIENSYSKAFDICFTNMVLNNLSTKLNQEFDKDGNIAKANRVNQKLLKEFLRLDFEKCSLGTELYQKKVLPILEKSIETTENKIATFTEYIAIKIANCLEKNSSVLITGGGAFNTYLIQLIREKSGAKIIVSDKELIDFKEALIFAFLGVLRVENIPNCLASVTGAEYDNIGGKISS